MNGGGVNGGFVGKLVEPLKFRKLIMSRASIGDTTPSSFTSNELRLLRNGNGSTITFRSTSATLEMAPSLSCTVYWN